MLDHVQYLPSHGEGEENAKVNHQNGPVSRDVEHLYPRTHKSSTKGSCGEVRSQSYRALDFKYITQEEFEDIYRRALEISKILHGLILKLQPPDKTP